MKTILEKVLDGFNEGIGIAGSCITIYDYLKNRENTHIEETFSAIREKAKEAYDSYCEYRKYRKDDIGVPLKEDILGYWESCLQRDILPSAADMVSVNIVSKEEANILFSYLLKAWMQIPDFTEWLHDVLTQNKLEKLSGEVMSLQENIKSISALTKELRQQDISNIAVLISPERIVDAKYACTESDRKHYYMVDTRFETMLRVISAKQDVPHRDAVQRVMEVAEDGHPVIITGNGGFGKTSLMMRAAVQWASEGRIAVWLSLSDKEDITPRKADAFWNCLTAFVPAGQRALVCIDNPYGDRISFSNLQKKCPDSDKIQLIMAERANRLTLLADPAQDCLMYWFDDAQMVVLQGLNQFAPTVILKDYDSRQFPDTQGRRKKILEKCIGFFVKEGIIKEKDGPEIIRGIFDAYSKPAVSAVELIYRTLFVLRKKASKPGNIILDWEEWGSFIEEEFGKGNSYTQTELYGVIAALSVFKMPTPISLFSKYFEINEKKLRSFLKEKFMLQHREPVILRNDALLPKHDVIAELFFLFQDENKASKESYINSIMHNLLQCMDEDEIEAFLAHMGKKNDLQDRKKHYLKKIAYRDYMNTIYGRVKKHTCNLSDTGMAYLCLGYLWSDAPEDAFESHVSVNDILNEIAPCIDGTKVMAVLYTEWGIWARNAGDNALAEEKYSSVVDSYPEDVQSRTELGRLLSIQSGREKEAEEIFRKVIKIDSRNIQSRTELGKLLSRQKGREKEAEGILREAIDIDPENLHPHTELGILLARQKGREKEAEDVLREAMRIDSRHVHSRTELGKLLTKQKGREKEAEEVLKEALKIDPEDIYALKALARLYERCNRKKEAAALYQKVAQIQSRKAKRKCK